MYGIDPERKVAKISRRQILRGGSVGALGIGLVVSQAKPAQANWGRGGGLFGRLHQRRNQCYAPAPVPQVCPQPAPYDSYPICPQHWVGTGFTGGVTVYYYYALLVSASPPCSPINPSPTYGMTFPSQITAPCCPPGNCVGGSFVGVHSTYSHAAGTGGSGDVGLDCSSKPERCMHYHMSDDDVDLEVGGLGGLSNDLPTFTPQNGATIVSAPKNYVFKGKPPHDKIYVACCQFNYYDGHKDRTIGVGLEFLPDPAAPPAATAPDPSKSGPIKGRKCFHYLIEDNSVLYHVVTSKRVK